MKSLITKNPGIEYFKQQLNQKLSEIEVDETLLYNETSYDIYIYCVIHYEKQLISDERMPVDEAKAVVETIINKFKTLK